MLEYRSLSNFWLKNGNLISWVWDRVEQAIQYMEQGKDLDPDTERRLIPDLIRNSDAELANYYINHYKIPMPYVKELVKA